MTPTLHANLLALRDAGKLRWYAGMMTTRHGRVSLWDDGSAYYVHLDQHGHLGRISLPADEIPDTTDRATRALFLDMAREVTGEPLLHVVPSEDDGGYHAIRPPTKGAPGLDGMFWKILGKGPTELEALIAAIMASPEKPRTADLDGDGQTE